LLGNGEWMGSIGERKAECSHEVVAMHDLSNYSSDPLSKAAEKINGDIGKRPLSEDEILVLACDEISHTYARAEKNYKA